MMTPATTSKTPNSFIKLIEFCCATSMLKCSSKIEMIICPATTSPNVNPEPNFGKAKMITVT